MDNQRLSGANVLVTGASNETGPYVARAFAREGANLFLTYYSDEQGVRETTTEVEEEGGDAHVTQLDLLDQDSVGKLIDAVRSTWDRLDVVVLCAGTVGLRNFRDLSREQLDTALDGNVKANFTLAKELGYWMEDAAGLGRIIQFTAQSAENTSHSAYGMAKAAQRENTSFLGWHLAPEVTVNTIQPISIDQDPDHEIGEEYDAPLERKVHSRELARMSVMLCDPVFDTVTGETIRMDSGRHTQPAYPKDL